MTKSGRKECDETTGGELATTCTAPVGTSARGKGALGNSFARAFITLGRAIYVDVLVLEEIVRAKGVNHGD